MIGWADERHRFFGGRSPLWVGVDSSRCLASAPLPVGWAVRRQNTLSLPARVFADEIGQCRVTALASG